MPDSLSGRAGAPNVLVAPLLLGPKNCEAAVGFPWRWVAAHAAELGVPFIGRERKRAVRADLFLAALERSGVTANDGAPPVDLAPVDAAENVRRLLGVRRRA